MRNILLAVLCTGTMLSVSRVSPAVDLNIEFNGVLLANTCIIAAGSRDMKVDLGSATSAALKVGEGAVVPFAITLEQCGSGASGVSLYFTGPAQPDSPLLQTQEMIDRNLAIEVKTDTGETLPLNTGQSLKASLTPGQDNILRFRASLRPFMYSKPVVPGTVTATMTYTLEYL